MRSEVVDLIIEAINRAIQFEADKQQNGAGGDKKKGQDIHNNAANETDHAAERPVGH